MKHIRVITGGRKRTKGGGARQKQDKTPRRNFHSKTGNKLETHDYIGRNKQKNINCELNTTTHPGPKSGKH